MATYVALLLMLVVASFSVNGEVMAVVGQLGVVEAMEEAETAMEGDHEDGEDRWPPGCVYLLRLAAMCAQPGAHCVVRAELYWTISRVIFTSLLAMPNGQAFID